MGWWPKRFGKLRERKLTTTASDPAVVHVLPGKLAARVYAHTIPNGSEEIPCWTYVTSGLWKLGQKDFIFSLRRSSHETPLDFPQDPLGIFAQIYELAERGRLVDLGDCTCFHNPAGFLGNTGQTGFAYIPPAHLPGLDLPPPHTVLAAILLTADEAAVVPSIGSYRLISLLGRASRYYPCPPWSDRQRPSVLTPEDVSQSILSEIPKGPVRGATVHTCMAPGEPVRGDGAIATPTGDIRLQIPRSHLTNLQEQMAGLRPEGGCAFLTDSAPEANARLVWRPGQTCANLITPPGSDSSCITGGFLAFVYGEAYQDGGQFLEDGFAMMLSLPSWARVLEAIRTGTSLHVPAAAPDQMGLAIQWTTTSPSPDRKPSAQDSARPSPVFQVARLFRYQPEEVLRRRIANFETWNRLINQVIETASDYWAAQPIGLPMSALLVVAVKPGEKSRFWMDCASGTIDTVLVRRLLTQLEELPVPTVREGPVAVAIHTAIWGGNHGAWEFIPKEWQEACEQDALPVPDGILELIWHD